MPLNKETKQKVFTFKTVYSYFMFNVFQVELVSYKF